MVRTKIHVISSIFLLAVSLSAQNDYDEVVVSIHPVSGTVYMVEGAGGNIGISTGENGIVMVDAQFAPLAEKIRNAIGGVSKGKVRFLINTHWHSDHTSGNVAFGKEAMILAHENVRKLVTTEQKILGNTREPLPEVGWPVLTFSDGVKIYQNGEEIDVIHVPAAHTDGDSIVWFRTSNVLHTGDLMFSGRFPFVDLDHGGNVVTLLAQLKKILPTVNAETQIIPGHGPLSNRSDLETYIAMIEETLGVVKEKIEKGESLEKIKEEGLEKKWSGWSWSFIPTDRWIELLYGSLTQS
ncbi:MAG TPA: MBL fold metallo-hydrolase [Thermoanaerobaculia bacterium]|nr:MBL fold metallo-hydrolase [Thermoanaerobaculia bacterium]HUM30222.1 MBL fold metallo-hydrolase [Thermoanaerobaculia bacterium]HXK68482.1 MBL fold metallo-hydrolase [Thermoanaerobaculia bacterium]